MHVACAHDRHRLVEQLHTLVDSAQRYEGKPLVRQGLALEVQIIESPGEFHGLRCRLGQGTDIWHGAADETEVHPAPLDTIALTGQHGASPGEPATSCREVVEALEIDASDGSRRHGSPALEPRLAQAAKRDLCVLESGIEVVDHVVQVSHLKADLWILTLGESLEECLPLTAEVVGREGGPDPLRPLLLGQLRFARVNVCARHNTSLRTRRRFGPPAEEMGNWFGGSPRCRTRRSRTDCDSAASRTMRALAWRN